MTYFSDNSKIDDKCCNIEDTFLHKNQGLLVKCLLENLFLYKHLTYNEGTPFSLFSLISAHLMLFTILDSLLTKPSFSVLTLKNLNVNFMFRRPGERKPMYQR